MRWTTAVGIVLGGAGGAIAALVGSPGPAPAPPVPLQESTRSAARPAAPAPPVIAAQPSLARAASAAPAPGAPSTSAAPADSAAPAAPAATPGNVPTTLEALHKAMVLCDQKKAFDECTRASFALDLGTTGPADPEQAKRFRKIALTHLVAQCEAGSAHACFVLAAKYRAGTELPASTNSAKILEKRAIDLCRHNSAPECPSASR